MKQQVILIGAGGHCKIIIESLDTDRFEIIGIIDSFTPKGTFICDIPVIGTDDDAEKIFKQGVHLAIVTIVGNLKLRRSLLDKYRKIGFHFPSVIHKTCHISSSAILGNGITVLANACINAEAKLDDFVTINTGAIIEHEVYVEENSHIAPGAVILGGSRIGKESMVGAGSTVLQQVVIGNYCMIGAGSVVLKNIGCGVTAYGNPAKEKIESRVI
ncbi:acetyltransferase [Luxibacter massiliensis]|uniref:acetyltransferase n=1 Tax=Luxibacter massiliensis TaxID=2219695 RepID=UPI000F05A301|nr:acetyltransferase [Luxibacter massiliensis]